MTTTHRRFLRHSAIACAVATLFELPNAAAQSAPVGPLPEPEPTKLVAVEPLEVTVRATPGVPDTFTSSRAAARVTEAEIVASSPHSLADALRGRAGVSVQQTTPGQGTIFVRGLSGREVMHLVDGVALNSAIFRAGNNPYLGLVDPYALTEIEVVRGASSALHGSDALAGVVAVTTRLPGYSLDPGGTTRARAFQEVGLHPFSSASRVSLEHGAAQWAVHLGFTHYQTGDIPPGGGLTSPVPESYHGLERLPGQAYSPATSEYQRGTAFQMFAGDAALRRRLGQHTEVVLRGQLGYQPELVRHNEIAPLFKNEFPERAEGVLAPFYRVMTSAMVAHRPTESALQEARFQIAWQRLHEGIKRRKLSEDCIVDGASVDVPAEECTGVLRLVPASAFDREKNRSDTLSARGEARFANAARTRGVRVGVDASHDLVTSEANTLDVLTGTLTPVPERFPSGSSMTQTGLYAQVEAELLRVLRVHAGARGGFFHLDIADRTVAGDTASSAFTRSIFDVAVNAGVRWELTPEVAWVVNGGRGVRAPNVQDFAALGTRANDRIQVPNPDLRPERTLSLDTGIKALLGRASLEAFIFHLRYDDAIALAPTTVGGATNAPSGERYERSENAAHVDYYGVESALDVPFTSAVGVKASALAMVGTLHNDPKLGLPLETPADRVPPAAATLGLWFAPIPVLRLEGTAYARLPQRRLNDPVNLEDNRIPVGGTPGFVTIRLQAAWQVRPNILVRMTADNITNALILEHGSGFYRAGANGAASVELRL